MVSRENLVTAAFVVLALPAAYAVRLALDSVGVGEDAAFGIAFLVLVGVGVGLPQYVLERR